MNKIKLNFAFLCLLAMIAVSVCLTSCGKDSDIISEVVPLESTEFNSDENQELESFILTEELIAESELIKPPKAFESKSDKEQQAYLQNLDDVELSKLKENYRIAKFLISIGIYEEVYNKLGNTDLFSDLDLSIFLSQEDKNALANYSANKTQSSGCYCSWTNSCRMTWCSGIAYARVWAEYCDDQFIGIGWSCSILC